MKINIIAYGIGIIIISAIFHFVAQDGINNCNSVGGMVSIYTSKDFADGCNLLLQIQEFSLGFIAIGTGIIIWGVFGKPRTR